MEDGTGRRRARPDEHGMENGMGCVREVYQEQDRYRQWMDHTELKKERDRRLARKEKGKRRARTVLSRTGGRVGRGSPRTKKDRDY